MSHDEYIAFLEARADGQPVRRRPASIRPFDGVLAKRVERAGSRARDRRPSQVSPQEGEGYGVVVAKTDDYLLIEECEKGVAAVVRAKAARVSKEDRLKAVRSEVVALKTRAELLENEARAIEAEDGFSNALAEGIRGAISKGGES